MKLCRIYCEGKSGSFDYDILEKVLGDLGPGIEIKPVGGKREAKSIMGYIENPDSDFAVAKADAYLLFRDRDFDAPVPDHVGLTQKDYVFFSYRTTIENYLLNPQGLYDFDREKGTRLFASVFDAENLMKDAAYDIKDYQSVRHALGVLRKGASFGTRWTEKDGVLPARLGLDDCIDEANRLILEAKIKTDLWNEAELRQEVERFLVKFDDDFFNRQDYLVWFQGKDLAKSICNRLNNFEMKSYYKFAKLRFDYRAFADLVELRTIVENKIQ